MIKIGNGIGHYENIFYFYLNIINRWEQLVINNLKTSLILQTLKIMNILNKDNASLIPLLSNTTKLSNPIHPISPLV